MHLKALSEKLGLEEAEYIDLLQLFIDTSEADLKKLGDAVLNGNKTLAAEAAHSLRGAALNMGFTEFSDISGQIESKINQGEAWAIEPYRCRLEAILSRLAQLARSPDSCRGSRK